MAPLSPSSLYITQHARTTLRSSLASPIRRSLASRSYASQSYGGGQGDPKGEKPQDQGANPVSSNVEHPGPPPPDVGKDTGGGPTKKGSGGHGGENTVSSGNGKGGGQKQSKGTNAPQPKILQDDVPPPGAQSDDVKAHNKEVAKRREKPHEGSRDEGDKVSSSFWKGRGGADRDP